MDDTLLFMPPCCIDRKLPIAVMQAPRRALTFYTQGDVIVEKFFHAAACLIDDINPHHKQNYCVMVLSSTVSRTSATGAMIVYLRTCFERGWITHLVLSTDKSVEDWLDIHMQEYRSRILYLHHKDVTPQASHMVLYNAYKAFTLTGPMLDTVSSKLSSYTMCLYPDQSGWSNSGDWTNPLRNACMPDVLRHRQQVRKEKREIKDMILNRFLKANFPPYDEDKEPESHRDYHDFSGM